MNTDAVLPSLLPLDLPDWVAAQRWYRATGRDPALRELNGWTFEDESGRAELVRTSLLLDSSGGEGTLYQIPLVYRSAPVDGAEHALIGTIGEDTEILWVYDGPQDPAYANALLNLILEDGSAGVDPLIGGPAHVLVQGHRHPDAADSRPVSSHILRGEQSNTSIIFEMSDAAGTPATPVICKVFRTLHHGENPDIVVQSALAAAGCTLVPPPLGHLSAVWRTDSGESANEGHLAFAQEFLPGVEDAWRVALRAAENGEDFTERARSLGEATAEVHELLARILPTEPTTEEKRAEIISGMRRRLGTAVAEVPELAPFADAVEAAISRAENVSWPPLQRIHGDYHLGQVVAVPGRGWVLLDFEGEPLRPLDERSRPDAALRDVAGMLRSFDYVAGSIEQRRPGSSVAEWARSARAAFLMGYADRTGADLGRYRVLLDAFEIDKAIYEAIYESRNRPSWLPIPITAISRLVATA